MFVFADCKHIVKITIIITKIVVATVVQFGLGHQIANLVTRVQIPAVALGYQKLSKTNRKNFCQSVIDGPETISNAQNIKL